LAQLEIVRQRKSFPLIGFEPSLYAGSLVTLEFLYEALYKASQVGPEQRLSFSVTELQAYLDEDLV